MLSKTALQRLVEKFDLYPDLRKEMPIDDIIERMRGKIGMVLQIPRPHWGEEPQPTAFRVQFTYPDPEVATRVTDELGHLFVDQNTKDRGAQAGATNAFLESQLAESRAKLEAQERRLEAFRQKHGPELPTQSQSNLQSLSASQLQAQSLVESIARDRNIRVDQTALSWRYPHYRRKPASDRGRVGVRAALEIMADLGLSSNSETVHGRALAMLAARISHGVLLVVEDDFGRTRWWRIAEIRPEGVRVMQPEAADPGRLGAASLSMPPNGPFRFAWL